MLLPFQNDAVLIEEVTYSIETQTEVGRSCGKDSADTLCLKKVRQLLSDCDIYGDDSQMYSQIYWSQSEGLFFPSPANNKTVEQAIISCGLTLTGNVLSTNTSSQSNHIFFISLLFITIILIPVFLRQK